MRSSMVIATLLALAGSARAQEAAPRVPAFQAGVTVLPMALGKLTTGPSDQHTTANRTSNLDAAYGLGLWFSYRIVAGLSVGVAPQAIFHLSAKDSDGYPVIDSEKEYDLMARLAYAYAVAPKLEVYAELLPGYSFVTFDKIVVGSKAPRAHGVVVAGGLGAAYALSDRFFVNAGVGYQLGYQVSHGITNQDVHTRFLRIALGAGARF